MADIRTPEQIYVATTDPAREAQILEQVRISGLNASISKMHSLEEFEDLFYQPDKKPRILVGDVSTQRGYQLMYAINECLPETLNTVRYVVGPVFSEDVVIERIDTIVLGKFGGTGNVYLNDVSSLADEITPLTPEQILRVLTPEQIRKFSRKSA